MEHKMEFRTLSELAAAKKYLRENGYEIKPINTMVNGRKGFVVENADRVVTVNDYGLLAFASEI